MIIKNKKTKKDNIVTPYVQLGARNRKGKIMCAENYNIDDFINAVTCTHAGIIERPKVLKLTLMDFITGKVQQKTMRWQHKYICYLTQNSRLRMFKLIRKDYENKK